GTGPLNYVVGGFYSNENTTNNFTRYLFTAVTEAAYKTKSLAGYAHADYAVTDAFKILGGIRWERDKISADFYTPILPAVQHLLSNGVVQDMPALQTGARGAAQATASFVNYDLGVQYKVAPDVMLYGTYSKAKQGPIYDSSDTTGLLTNTLAPLPQESVKSWEAGMKSQFFNRNLTLNLSVFNSNYQNYQVQTSIVDPVT
ncbi:TonB-dependent receptor domain-containing protein, partial [Dactylosporangium matsuzakiense]